MSTLPLSPPLLISHSRAVTTAGLVEKILGGKVWLRFLADEVTIMWFPAQETSLRVHVDLKTTLPFFSSQDPSVLAEDISLKFRQHEIGA